METVPAAPSGGNLQESWIDWIDWSSLKMLGSLDGEACIRGQPRKRVSCSFFSEKAIFDRLLLMQSREQQRVESASILLFVGESPENLVIKHHHKKENQQRYVAISEYLCNVSFTRESSASSVDLIEISKSLITLQQDIQWFRDNNWFAPVMKDENSKHPQQQQTMQVGDIFKQSCFSKLKLDVVSLAIRGYSYLNLDDICSQLFFQGLFLNCSRVLGQSIFLRQCDRRGIKTAWNAEPLALKFADVIRNRERSSSKDKAVKFNDERLLENFSDLVVTLSSNEDKDIDVTHLNKKLLEDFIASEDSYKKTTSSFTQAEARNAKKLSGRLTSNTASSSSSNHSKVEEEVTTFKRSTRARSKQEQIRQLQPQQPLLQRTKFQITSIPRDTSSASPSSTLRYLTYQLNAFAELPDVIDVTLLVCLHAKNLIRLQLSFSHISLTSKFFADLILPLFNLPVLKEIELDLSKCFDTNPICGDTPTSPTSSETLSKAKPSSAAQSKSKQKARKKAEKQSEVVRIVEKYTAVTMNPSIEVININLEKNTARDIDIEAFLLFIDRAFPSLIDFEISWAQSNLTDAQVKLIARVLSEMKLKSQLRRLGVILWKNYKVNDENFEEIAQAIQQFTSLVSLKLGLIECSLTSAVGSVVHNLLDSLGFLESLEIGFDDCTLNEEGIAAISLGLHKQRLLKFLGLSFEDARVIDGDLTPLANSLEGFTDLREFHLFFQKNSVLQSSIESVFSRLAASTSRLRVLNVGLAKNVIINEHNDQHHFISASKASSDSLVAVIGEFLQNQLNLEKLEFSIRQHRIGGASVATILSGVSRSSPITKILLNLEGCRLNTAGFSAVADLFGSLQHPLKMEKLIFIADHNTMGMTSIQQQILASSLGRFANLLTLELDLSGCNIHSAFFEELSPRIAEMERLTALVVIMHRISLNSHKLKLLMMCLQQKPLLEELTFEVQESLVAEVDSLPSSISEDDLKFEQEVLTSKCLQLKSLRALSVNILRSNLSLKVVSQLLKYIGGGVNEACLEDFASFSLYMCEQNFTAELLSEFTDSLKPFEKASEITLMMDLCGLTTEMSEKLFKQMIVFQQLKAVDISLNMNTNVSIVALSSFLCQQHKLESLSLSLKSIVDPVENFGSLGLVLVEQPLKAFTLFFEHSTIHYPRQLEYFYSGLAALFELEKLILHLHNLDHSMMQILPFAEGLSRMTNLQMLNLHLPNSMIRSSEVREIALSLGNKPNLRELQLEFFKNEIMDKSGVFFASSICQLTNLRKLDFSLMRCEVLPCIVEKLCLSMGVLKHMKKLHLYFGENPISSFTLTSLTYSFQCLPNIIDLKINLQETGVGDEGVEQLGIGLSYLPNLISLDLNLENTDVSSDSLISLGSYFHNHAKRLRQLEISLRNNTQIAEDGFRALMEGIGNAGFLTHLLLLFNNCLMEAAVATHLPACLQNKRRLKYLHIYFDQNSCDGTTAERLGRMISTDCPKVKHLTLCFPQNNLGNEGTSRMVEHAFKGKFLKKTTVDIRFNEISTKETIHRIAAAVAQTTCLAELELLIFEDNDVHDLDIAKGLFALAQIKLDLCFRMTVFEVRNNIEWKDFFKNTIIPIATVRTTLLMNAVFHRFIAPLLQYNTTFSFWDLYFP